MKTFLPRALALLPWLLGLLVIALAVAVWVTRDDPDERPRATVGALFQREDLTRPLGQGSEAILPWATLEVAAESTDSLPDLGGGRANVQAPEDGGFVQVQVHSDPFARPGWVATTWPYANRTEIVLRADDRDYPLTGTNGFELAPDNTPRGRQVRWVAVEGHPEHLSIVIRLDGEEQVVNIDDGSVELGRAAALKTAGSTRRTEGSSAFRCGRWVRTDDSPLRTPRGQHVECRVSDVTRTPYADGLGWAEPGHEFLAVTLEVPQSLSVLVAGQPWKAITLAHYMEKLSFSARLDGEPSLTDSGSDHQLSNRIVGKRDDRFVFDVVEGEDVGDLTFVTHVDARPNVGFDDPPDTLRLRWTIPGRKLS